MPLPSDLWMLQGEAKCGMSSLDSLLAGRKVSTYKDVRPIPFLECYLNVFHFHCSLFDYD